MEAIYNYLSGKGYPEGLSKEKKRDLRKRAQDFHLKDGLLHYRGRRKTLDSSNLRLVIVDEESKQRVLRECHEGEGNVHFGRNKSMNKMRQSYYWSGMFNDLRNYIKSCHICHQKTKSKTENVPPVNDPDPVPSEPWREVGVQLLGTFPETAKRANKFIVIIIDYFTLWPEAEPISDNTAKSVASFIYQSMTRHGYAEVIILDHEPEFLEEVNKFLCRKTGSVHRIIRSSESQAGQIEKRFGQTLQQAISKAVNEEQRNWDEVIDDILFAYRTSIHATTKYTPFFLMYGQEAILPSQLEFVDPQNSLVTEEDEQKALERRLRELDNLRKSRNCRRKPREKKEKL